MYSRHCATICEKCQQIKDNLNVVVSLRKFGKRSEEMFSNYESGGRTFESFRARHLSTTWQAPKNFWLFSGSAREPVNGNAEREFFSTQPFAVPKPALALRPSFRLRAFLRWAEAFPFAPAGDALLERVHKVHDIVGAALRLGPDHPSIALGIDEFSQCLFVMILKLLRLKAGCPLIDDMSCEVEHILRDLHVLDFVEILMLVAYLVG